MAIAVLASLSYKRWYGGVGGGRVCGKWRHNCIQIEFTFWANYERVNEDISRKGDFWRLLNKQLSCG